MARPQARESEPKTERPPTKITNLQKVGKLRFSAKKTDPTKVVEVVDIEAQQTGEVPAHIWDRYKDRPAIKAMDGVEIVVGGLKPGQKMETPSAQQQALVMQAKELDAQREELERMRMALDAREAELIRGVGN